MSSYLPCSTALSIGDGSTLHNTRITPVLIYFVHVHSEIQLNHPRIGSVRFLFTTNLQGVFPTDGTIHIYRCHTELQPNLDLATRALIFCLLRQNSAFAEQNSWEKNIQELEGGYP